MTMDEIFRPCFVDSGQLGFGEFTGPKGLSVNTQSLERCKFVVACAV